uniref:Toxin-antitoxin system YwqK family antitoxin n=1 Tax=Fundidesulfovibrio putealis TaxID=270496 RepID=A0A7C4AHK5_9BACT
MPKLLALLLAAGVLAASLTALSQAAVSSEDMEERAGLLYKSGDSTPYTGAVRDLHQSGKPRLEAHYQAGKLTSSRIWYENGQLAEEVSVSQDTWTIRRFSENGRLEDEIVARFQGGRKVSEQSRMWHDNGKLRSEAGFQAGKLHGPLREYDPNGVLVRDEVYEQGKLVKKNK